MSEERISVGEVRSFGDAGPVYLVTSVDEDAVEVMIPSTGEELRYSHSEAIRDPLAE